MGRRIVLVLCVGFVAASYRSDGGFLPSQNYNQRTEDQLAEPSARVDKSDERLERDNPDRKERFGITGYGSTGSYGGTAPGVYGPVKIDLGGVLLGSILGFGAVIILPKIIHAFSYGYGGYGRSADSDFSQLTDVLSRMDEALSRYNIDSTSCMQRLACAYVQLANENMVNGNATEFDAVLASVSSNTLVRRMLAGTPVYEGIAAGKSADTDCQHQYPKCKMDKKTIVKVLTQVLPS
ncbi:uncharacterized protein LOC121726271 [Aricia agestis]|uniref:uncharacterized protein LOC121726271 n=1 Tax=Aricia agestis TaxID=91739 RepID=UPI001C209C60|nr:uncharacterized protein LOC121726271 [Aricia agestis]